MARYTRLFLVASVVYLLGGAAFGMLMAVDSQRSPLYRFIHIHFLFLGFMVMLCAGLVYELLPRIRGAQIRWPNLVPTHFYLANIGLVGKCLSFVLQRQIGSIPFAGFATLTVISLILFSLNLIASLPTSSGAQRDLSNQAVPNSRKEIRRAA
ncbi:MAG TPA: hypothetical protein VGX68_05680 [Thermoanaerobaculia bacterium]|nr:hypothetical protein [Thermoanaerobaculia bacterium]